MAHMYNYYYVDAPVNNRLYCRHNIYLEMTVTLGVHWACHLVLIALCLQVPHHLYIEHEHNYRT